MECTYISVPLLSKNGPNNLSCTYSTQYINQLLHNVMALRGLTWKNSYPEGSLRPVS